MRSDHRLARRLAARGWGVFPCYHGDAKDPVQARAADDPRNDTGRLVWTRDRLDRWRDPRWQDPEKNGGHHQAVWCVEHVDEVWPKQGLQRLVGVVHYEVLVVDVDNGPLAAADDEAAAFLAGCRALGAFEVETQSGGRHLYLRWPESGLKRRQATLRTADGLAWGDMKGGGKGYTIAPGQRTDPDDRFTGYWSVADELATLPPPGELPALTGALARVLGRISGRRKKPSPQQAESRRRKAAMTRRAKKRGAAPRCKLVARGGRPGSPGAWVDRAVAEAGMEGARVRQKPAHGCHDFMASMCGWAGKHGKFNGPTEERLRYWWRRWGGFATRKLADEFEDFKRRWGR